MFSLDPRSQGEWAWHKLIGVPVMAMMGKFFALVPDERKTQ